MPKRKKHHIIRSQEKKNAQGKREEKCTKQIVEERGVRKKGNLKHEYNKNNS